MFKVKVMDLPRFSLGGMESINFRSRLKLAATPMNCKRPCTEVLNVMCMMQVDP